MKPASTLSLTGSTTTPSSARRAVVTAVKQGGRRVSLRSRDRSTTDAIITVPSYRDPQVGDEVLTQTDDRETYVIGIIRALRASKPETSPHEAHDAEGRLLFRFDPDSGVSEVFVNKGDLRFRVNEGSLAFNARDGISLQSENDLRFESHRSVELTVGLQREKPTSTLIVDPNRLGASAPEMLIAAGKAHVATNELALFSETFETTVTKLKQVARTIETQAHRIVEKTHNSYRSAEGLSQTKAGRIRSVAAKGAQLIGDHVLLKAKRDMKVKGDKIYLA